MPWKCAHLISEEIRNRCGVLPNNSTAAFVNRPLFNRFKCPSNASGEAFTASGNCLSRRAVAMNRAMHSKSRAVRSASTHGVASNAPRRSSSMVSRYSTRDAYNSSNKSSDVSNRLRISPVSALPINARIFGCRTLESIFFRKIRRCLPSAVAWSNSRSVGDSSVSSSAP